MALKRRVQLLASLEGRTVTLATGLHLALIERVTNAHALVELLRGAGPLDARALEANVELSRPPMAVTPALLAAAHRDVRALSVPPARALAREHRKALARYGEIDDAWLAGKRARIDALARALEGAAAPRAWFDRALEIVRAVHGDASAERLGQARVRLLAVGAERRKLATSRVDALVHALTRRATDPALPAELEPLALRLERARDLPGRARRTRALEILRAALGWPDAPADAARPIADPGARADFAGHVKRAGDAMIRALPAAREPRAQAETEAVLAKLGLLVRVGDDGVPLASYEDVTAAKKHLSALEELEGVALTLAQALRLAALPIQSRHDRRRIARWVTDGLELDLVASAYAAGHGATLLEAANARAARAYATWALRLLPTYRAAGIDLRLSPDLFSNLPKSEDLGVLAVCLMETERKAGADPIAVLDATLGLFQKLPAKAGGLLGRLRGTTPGAGRAAFPAFAAWLGDDARLDRYVHLARMAGRPVALSKALREDFDHADKSARERAHLEALPARSARQEARLAALGARDRSLEGAPRGRTLRRLADAIDALMPVAYRRELDATFRDILKTAWGITVPGALTPAWRDAVRFWLVVDQNRDLLGQLLRLAAATPGADVKLAFAKNRAWLDKARFRTAPWLAPRREALAGGMMLSMEEDPLEVLRMGIPFGTCLALETGFNAASTVVNAVDVNKRVLYVRNRDGKVVARKLLAVTDDGRLLGYNLYVATGGPEAQAIRDAVARTCKAIASEAGLRMSTDGEPKRLHGTFWYDDGTVPFEEAEPDVGAYCRALGLAPPKKSWDDLSAEARGQAAIGRGDVEGAIEALDRWSRAPANRRLGQWIVERLGRREALRRSATRAALLRPLMEAHDEDALIASIALAAREEHGAAVDMLEGIFPRFPASERVARALARTCARGSGGSRDRLSHLSFDLVPRHLTTVAGAFDVLDEVEPAWLAVVAGAPSCRSCMEAGEAAALGAVLDAFDLAPDHDAVTSCLSTRRRSALSHRVALGVAARRVLEGGARAVARLVVLEPDLAVHPHALAATIRQEGLSEITGREHLLVPNAPPFEALGDLLLSCRGLDRVLGDHARPRPADIAKWDPGPWELAYRRRSPHPTLREHLIETARRTALVASREMELLALMGDEAAFDAMPPPSSRRLGKKALGAIKVTPPKLAKARTECETLARSLATQSLAAAEGRVVDLRGAKIVDRNLVEIAIARLGARRTPADELALAADIVATAAPRIRWPSIVSKLAARRDEAGDAAARRVLAALPPGRAFSPAQLADAWTRAELRPALVGALSRSDDDEWAGFALASQADGLTEAWGLAKVERGHESVVVTATADQLWLVIRAAALDAPPDRAVWLYRQLPDELSAAFFVRAVAELPRARRSALREAATKQEWTEPRDQARRAWLDHESPSLQKRRSSSIERG